MNRSNFDGEMIPCPKCGKEYASFYHECPYCEAERMSRGIIKHGRMRGKGELLGSLILGLVLVVGGIYLAISAVTSNGLSVGREYAVETVPAATVQVGVTEQEVVIASGQETVPEETIDTGEEDSQGDSEDDEDEDSEE